MQLKDSTIVTLTSQDELDELRASCGEGRGRGGRRGKCFKPIFPITLNFADGTSATVNDKEEAKAAKEAWKAANPDATERPSIAMPFDVQLKDSTIVSITSQEDLDALKETCASRGGRGGKCFKPVFPLSLTFEDGSSVDVADRAAAKEAVEAWKEANPDATERPTIAFPYEVELADGSIVTVENEEAETALKEDCGPRKGGRSGRN